MMLPRLHDPSPEIVYPLSLGHRRVARTDGFPLSLVTIPGAALYRAASQKIRHAGLRAQRGGWEGVTVVSVGNLEVGGNRKTPFSTLLIDRLTKGGHRPVYVSRGFRSDAERIKPVTIASPKGLAACARVTTDVRLVRSDTPSLSRAIGDEAAMVAMRCPGTPLVLSGDKRRAIDLAVELFQPTHVVLDDAFQSWRVHRDVDIVLVDGDHPFGNGRLVPAGTLREPPDALSRAHLIGVNGYRSPDDLDEFAGRVHRLTSRPIPVFGLAARLELLGASSGCASERVEPPAASLSSIARPQRFDDMLGGHGVDVALSIRYPDHHRYSEKDLDHIHRLLRERGCSCVITTEKDWAKLREMEGSVDGLIVARMVLTTERVDILAYIERPQTSSAAVR